MNKQPVIDKGRTVGALEWPQSNVRAELVELRNGYKIRIMQIDDGPFVFGHFTDPYRIEAWFRTYVRSRKKDPECHADGPFVSMELTEPARNRLYAYIAAGLL